MAKKRISIKLGLVLTFDIFIGGKYKTLTLRIGGKDSAEDKSLELENMKQILLPLSGLVNGKIKVFNQGEFEKWESKGFKHGERPTYNVLDSDFDGEIKMVKVAKEMVFVGDKYVFADDIKKD